MPIHAGLFEVRCAELGWAGWAEVTCAVLCCAALCHDVLCCATLSHAVLCYALPRHAALRSTAASAPCLACTPHLDNLQFHHNQVN